MFPVFDFEEHKQAVNAIVDSLLNLSENRTLSEVLHHIQPDASVRFRGEQIVRRILLLSAGCLCLVVGCGRGGASAPPRTTMPDGSPVPKMSLENTSFSLQSNIEHQSPKERAETFKRALKATPEAKRAYVEEAKKYVDDPDPEVKAAANELIQSADR
jgi:hypothetical protein